MKVPKIFVPEKCLENKIQQFLKYQAEGQACQGYDNNLKNIDIEIGIGEQYLEFFDQSLALLKEKGYERHLYPWESFRILINYFENKKVQRYFSLNKLAEEMLQCGEWFSMAVERKKNKLICYLDPEYIRWDNDQGRYVIDLVLIYSSKKEFCIDGFPFGEWVDLKSFDDNFVKYFYTRKFEDLPQQIKCEAQVFLPEDGVLWPVGRGRKKVMSITFDSNRASRGVRMKR